METLDELVEVFSHTVDEKTIFIATKLAVPVGTQRRFLITLKSGTPVLCGHAEVCESPALLAGPGSPSGIRLRMLRLTRDSATVHARVLDVRRERAAAAAAPARPLPPPPPPRKGSATGIPEAINPEPEEEDEETGVAKAADLAPAGPEDRVPPSPFILPANPLSELSDKNLHAIIECAMYEDPGTGPPPPGPESDEMIGLAPRSGDTMVRRFDERTVDLEALARLVERITPAVEARIAHAAEPAPARVPLPAPPEPAPPPPPTIIEVPGPPVKVSVGFASQALTAILGIAVGAIAVYAILELDVFGRKSSSPPPAAPVAAPVAAPAAAPPADAAPAAEPAAEPAAVPATDTAPTAAAAATPDAGVEPAPPPEPPAAAAAVADGTCTATIEAPTEKATVLVDGKRIGYAPVRDLPVPCDQAVEIAIQHPRYQPFSQRAVARSGSPIRLRPHLERPQARLKLTSTPAGAILTVDGKVVGRAPFELDVTAYTNLKVSGTLDGYQKSTRKVRVPVQGSTVHLRLAERTASP